MKYSVGRLEKHLFDKFLVDGRGDIGLLSVHRRLSVGCFCEFSFSEVTEVVAEDLGVFPKCVVI